MANPELYPFDLRPQGHDIISFWLFHTIVKCYEHTGEVPFDAVMINGHVLDENREKMSKSKGNVVLPREVMAEYPIDAIRFWAASASVGDDFPFSDKDITAGEKLLRKLWNASKLVDQLAPGQPDEPDELAAIDRWLLAELDDAVADITAHFEAYEFAKARDRLRTFFWNTFCDDYLEIAKQREREARSASEDASGERSEPRAGEESMEYALRTAHRTFLLLWAPILPHVTEELWQATYAEGTGTASQFDSVHTERWPTERGYDADLAAGETAMAVISALRRYKSERQLPLNADLASVTVHGDVAGFEDAIRDVMHVGELEVRDDEPEIATEIASIGLEYATLGPQYGAKVGEIDDAIDAGEFELDEDAGVLRVAGEELDEELFEVAFERTYSGDGEMLETDDAVVIVREE